MTAKLFGQPIKQSLPASDVAEGELASILARGATLLDGEEPTKLHVLPGGHVVEGTDYAAYFAADGSVTVSSLSEAEGEDDEEEEEPEGEEDGEDSEDDDEEEPADDEEEPADDEEEPEGDDEEDDEEEVEEAETVTGRYAAIAGAIAGTSLPRKLKRMAAEALAARFEELPGSFQRERFVRSAIAGGAGDEEVEQGEEESVVEARPGDPPPQFKVTANGKIVYTGADADKAHKAHLDAAMRREYTEKWRDAVMVSYSGKKPKGFKSESVLDESQMTRKHYAMVAQALAELDMSPKHKRELVGAVASTLAQFGANFHRARFIKATGLSAAQVSETREEAELDVTYCDEGVQLTAEDVQLALVRCDTASPVESAKAINAIVEYAEAIGYQHVPDDVAMDEDATDEDTIIEAEYEAIDDLRALVTLAISECTPEEVERFGATIRGIDEAINECDFELAEQLAEPLLEYKRMSQAARRARIRSIRTGIPQSVRKGKVSRGEHRRSLIKRRRDYRMSAGKRSKAKRYAKRTARFRARLRPLPGAKSESVDSFLRHHVGPQKRETGQGDGGLTTRPISESLADAKRNGYREANEKEVERDSVCGHCEHFDSDSDACTMFRFVVKSPYDYRCDKFERMEESVDEARVSNAEREHKALVNSTYGKWFDRVPVNMLKLPALNRDISALLASEANLNVEMPKLVAKYRAESVDEAGDKLGVLAGEVMTYLINRPRATAEDLQRKFRVSSSAAQSIMGIAAQALAAGEGKGSYPEHVKAIGDTLARDNAFEAAEGEYRRFFGRALTEGDVIRGHQLKIALATLKMHGVGAQIMGGMTHTQAIGFLYHEANYSRAKIEGLLKKAGHDAETIATWMRAALDESIDQEWHDFSRQVNKNLREKEKPNAKKMKAKGYAFVIFFTDDGTPEPLYTKTADQAARLVRTEYPNKRVFIQPIDALLAEGASYDKLRQGVASAKERDLAYYRGEGAKIHAGFNVGGKPYHMTFTLDGMDIVMREEVRPGQAPGKRIANYSAVPPAVKDATKRVIPGAIERLSKRDESVEEGATTVTIEPWSDFGSYRRARLSNGWFVTHGKVKAHYSGPHAYGVFEPGGAVGASGRSHALQRGGGSSLAAALKAAGLTLSQGESVEESGPDYVLPLVEAVQIPTNAKHTIRDPKTRGAPVGEDPKTIEVPALKVPKATVFMSGEMFGNWNKHEVNDLVLWNAPYAQYDSALHVQFRAKGKRKTYARVLTYKPRIVVYDGWGIDLEPESLLGDPKTDTTVGVEVRHGRRMGFDQGWDDEMQRRVAAYVKKPRFAVFEGTLDNVSNADLDEARKAVKVDPAVIQAMAQSDKFLQFSLDRGLTPELIFQSEIEPNSANMRKYRAMARKLAKGKPVDEAKQIPPIDSPIYTEKVKWPKHNVKIGPLGPSHSAAGKLLRRRLPGWTKADHLAAAAEHEKLAKALDADWSKTADVAAQATWGRPYRVTDYRVSGVASDEFSDDHKEKLRHAAQTATAHRDAAFAHREAAKGRGLAKDESLAEARTYAFKSAAGGDYAGNENSAQLAASVRANVSLAKTAREIDHATKQVSYLAASKSINRAQADELRDLLRAKKPDYSDPVAEAKDPLDDIPARPDMSKGAKVERELEDAMTNAVFNDTRLGKGFERFYKFAGAMMRAGHAATPKDARFEVEYTSLRDALRTGGTIDALFQGSKADARVIAKAMMAEAWGGVPESVDEAKRHDFKVGDRVAYKASFLRSIGSYTGLGHARGKVTKVDTFGKAKLVTIAWDGGDAPERVLDANLSLVSDKHGIADEAVDEKAVECSVCGKRKEKYSGSDAEPMCYECDKRMEKLRDKQHASAKKSREQDESIDEGIELPDGRVFDPRAGRIHEGMKKQLDFREYEALVRTWHDKQLTGALADLKKTLPAADRLDRSGEGSGNEGGYYRDQASVIHREIERRRKGGAREESADVGVYEEDAYNAIDEAKRKKMKGYWRTTERGQRIFIENGKITKGNPHLMRAVGGGSSTRDKGFAKGAQKRADAAGYGGARRALLKADQEARAVGGGSSTRDKGFAKGAQKRADAAGYGGARRALLKADQEARAAEMLRRIERLEEFHLKRSE